MPAKRWSPWKWALGTVAFVVFAGLWIYVFTLGTGFKTYRNVSTSMNPTVFSGEILMADLHAYRRKPLQRGDVVVMQHGESVLIKRVIGLPGDTVELKNAVTVVNGHPVSEPYTMHDGELPGYDTIALRTVAPDELFLMGDNRDHSLDSRMEEFGHVHLEDVLGQVTYVLVPGPGSSARRVQ